MKAEINNDNHIALSWANPPDAARVLILRKTRDYPRDIRDGIVVLDAAPAVDLCMDESPDNGRFNYYRAFLQDAGGAWLDAAVEDFSVRIRCETAFDYHEKLHGNLPELYDRHDENQELYRFLGIIAWELEKFRAMQSGLNDVSNVNEVRDDLLEHLAWNVGWLLNRELPVLRQRAEIKRAVAIYRKKGTKRGLIDLIQGIMNWDMEIVRCNRNILTTNLAGSTTLNISDPAVTMNMDTAADTAAYILGQDKTPNTIRLRLKATYDFHMFERVRNKLFRILRFWVPACMNVLLELATENQEPGGVSDWRPPGADTLALNWLITNSPERTTNNPLWRTVNLSSL